MVVDLRHVPDCQPKACSDYQLCRLLQQQVNWFATGLQALIAGEYGRLLLGSLSQHAQASGYIHGGAAMISRVSERKPRLEAENMQVN